MLKQEDKKHCCNSVLQKSSDRLSFSLSGLNYLSRHVLFPVMNKWIREGGQELYSYHHSAKTLYRNLFTHRNCYHFLDDNFA